MGRYVLRRLLELIPAFFGTTFLIYWLVWVMPGDPFAGKCGDRRCPESYVRFMTEKYHLDNPLPVQYLHYMTHLLTGDLGQTFGGRDIADIIAAAYPNTAKLAVVAIVFETAIGIAAGVLSALRRNGFFDNLVLISTLLMMSTPIFVLAFLLQFILGVRWEIIEPTVAPDTPLHQLIVPGLVLGSGAIGMVARLTRTSIMESGRADYVRFAVAKGLPRRRVVGVHMLRNSLIPVVTFLGIDLGGLLGGAIIIEGIFNIHGVGYELYRAIVTKEGATVVGLVVVVMMAYLVMNVLVDLLYAALDPRIRYV
jgi:oligopeptide transport system permease protein